MMEWLTPKAYRGPWSVVKVTSAHSYETRADGRRRAVPMSRANIMPDSWVDEGMTAKGKWFRGAYYSTPRPKRDSIGAPHA